jgi:hypothetical protein
MNLIKEIHLSNKQLIIQDAMDNLLYMDLDKITDTWIVLPALPTLNINLLDKQVLSQVLDSIQKSNC